MDKVSEEAIKKGVPMPETCKKMNWESETFLSWLETDMDGESKEYSVVKTSDYKRFKLGFFQRLIPAPQIQEIWLVLPKNIYEARDEANDDREEVTLYFAEKPSLEFDELQEYFFALNDSELGYAHSEEGEFHWQFSKKIRNNHIVEGFSELYLQLKSESVIQ